MRSRLTKFCSRLLMNRVVFDSRHSARGGGDFAAAIQGVVMRKATGEKSAKNEATRTVMAMATEMAEAKRAMDKACVLFQALAGSIGVNVTNAFIID